MNILTTLTAASVLALTACSQAEAPKIETPAVMNDIAEKAGDMATMETRTKAVLLYASWCGSCKVLDPTIKAVQAMGTMPGLEFVTLDYTDKNDDNFYAQAEAAGVGAAVKAYLDGTVKTGQLLLVDIDDQTVVGTVTKKYNPEQIVTALQDAITAS